MTIQEVSEKFGYCQPTIAKILRMFKVKPYSKARLFSPELDEGYFDNIDSEAKAYFLGLIMTDGCIHTTKGRTPLLAMSIKAEDDYILHKFKDEIHSNKKITSDGRGYSEIQIVSKRIVDALKTLGVTERKSLKEVLPYDIDKRLMNHFIRGVFDGDGNFSFRARTGRKVHQKSIRLCGGVPLLEAVVKYLHNSIGTSEVNLIKEQHSDGLYAISYSRKADLIKLSEYLYSDATIYLERKKRICDLIYEEAVRYTK